MNRRNFLKVTLAGAAFAAAPSLAFIENPVVPKASPTLKSGESGESILRFQTDKGNLHFNIPYEIVKTSDGCSRVFPNFSFEPEDDLTFFKIEVYEPLLQKYFEIFPKSGGAPVSTTKGGTMTVANIMFILVS